MSSTQHLTLGQRRIVAGWLDDGYTPQQIIHKINRQRDDNVLVPDDDDTGIDTAWPPITRGGIEYHQNKRGDLAPDRDSAISVLSGTMLGTKAAHLRRLAEQIGRLEELIDEVYVQLTEEILAGALKGAPLSVAMHSRPSFVQAEYAVDGIAMGLTSIRSERTDDDDDVSVDNSRSMRAVAIMATLQKLLMAWEKLMFNAQRVSGLHNVLTKDEQALAVTSEQNATVKRLFEEFSKSRSSR
jgi:hypothetical protein